MRWGYQFVRAVVGLVARRSLNLGILAYFISRERLYSRRDIICIFERKRMEAELARPLFKKIKFLMSKPSDRVFLEIGLVLDVWDFEESRWPFSALLQVAKFYDCTPEATLRNYEIIVTPFQEHHGTVWARRLISSEMSAG